MQPRFPELKAYQREHREDFPAGLGLRVHRALSWLARAEQEPDDPDARFLFLWVGFNAAYAMDLGPQLRQSEANTIGRFLDKICGLDKERSLYNLLWERYTTRIRVLLDNRYVFQPFWDYHNGDGAEDWEAQFEQFQKEARAALTRMHTATLLGLVLRSLYTLRNQLVHGGATWNSSVNREQATLGADLLGDIVPRIIEVMMKNPNELWGDPSYPVVKD